MVANLTDARVLPLRQFDIVLINTSGGKDSQVMLDEMFLRCERDNLVGNDMTNRMVAVHADLGEVEWPGTAELAEEQAQHYNVPFIVTKREQDTLLEYVEKRQKWPSSTTRFCTSEFKRAPCQKVMTRLVNEWRERTGSKQPCKILNCMGFRAAESPARAKRLPLTYNRRASTKTTRRVWDYLPIHHWETARVWSRISRTSVRHHWAYDRGMGRLSCRFCIFAPRNQLMVAAVQPENKELFEKYVQLETKIGHTFKAKESLKEIQTAIAAGEKPVLTEDGGGCWNM